VKRVVIVGTAGSGKSTLARVLAERLGAPMVELDAFQWGPGWTRVPRSLFRDRASAALAADRWVAAGNYPRHRDVVWARADTLVWLDYPLRLVLCRLARRTVTDLRVGGASWGGNRNTLGRALSRDSLFLFAIHTHRRWRLLYPRLLRDPRFAHLRVHRFRSAGETARWIAAVAAPCRGE
jgi:hypothetical protein